MSHVRSNIRLQSQLLEKLCELSSKHSFDPILMKMYQNICHHLILTAFETGSCGVKN